MTPRFKSLLTCLFLGATAAAGPGLAQSPPGEPPAQSASNPRLGELMRLVTAGDEAALLQHLQATAGDPALPAAEREQLLLDFTARLRALQPGAVGRATLDFLSGYEPRVMVPHEDHPVSMVPQFNIRAAATGLEHAWRRQEAAYAGAVLLAQDPTMLVQAYWLHDDPPVRLGLIQALAGASPGQLELVSFMALNGLEHEPELAALAGEAALRNGDTRALEQILRTGRGSTITPILRQAGTRLSPFQLERLLDAAIEQARPEIAALTMAELAPALIGQPTFEQRLLGLLGNAELGAAAALTLAAHPSDNTVSQLAELQAGDTAPLTAARARLALELMQIDRPVGVQP
jgi:hypothetical protein